MARPSLKRAAATLAANCGVMARLVTAVGPPRLRSTGSFTHFGALVHSIVYQQLQGKAAAAIHARLVAVLGEVTPPAVLRRRPPTLRAAGLSAAKEASIRDLARKVVDGTVTLDHLPRMTDARIVEQLVQVRGIGPWTAEMFLIFQLRRFDVWPVLDYGVRKGYAFAYGLPELPTSKELAALGERFRPFRSVAAWYCWRATELEVLP